MNFFNIPAIENDEYIYSYVLRLANANGFDLKTFLQVVLDQVWGYERKRAYDLDLDIVKISELIGLERALPFYLKTTLFNGIAPFMTRDNIGKRVNAVNYYVFSNMKTLEGYEHLLNDLKICPECMKEAKTSSIIIEHIKCQVLKCAINTIVDLKLLIVIMVTNLCTHLI